MEFKKIEYKIDTENYWIGQLYDEIGDSKIIESTISSSPPILLTVHPSIGKGHIFYMPLGPDLAAMYVKINYKRPVRFRMINKKGEYFPLNFSLYDGLKVADPLIVGSTNMVSLMDSCLEAEYEPSKQTSMDVLRIIMKRDYAVNFANRVYGTEKLGKMFDNRKNTVFIQMHMSQRIARIMNDLSSKELDSPAMDYYISGAVYTLLAGFMDLVKFRKKPVMAVLASKDIDAIKQSEKLILESLKEEFPGIEKLAQISYMSPTKYKQLFSKIYGFPPKKYFMTKKMELAREMLTTGRYKVYNVAYALGFSNISLFARRFKSHFGIQPSQLFGKPEQLADGRS